MTDMRATERLLEVIDERRREIASSVSSQDAHGQRIGHLLMDIGGAIDELRRRGDTLVRAEDLRLVLADATGNDFFGSGEPAMRGDFYDARDRLENALGGKMR